MLKEHLFKCGILLLVTLAVPLYKISKYNVAGQVIYQYFLKSEVEKSQVAYALEPKTNSKTSDCRQILYDGHWENFSYFFKEKSGLVQSIDSKHFSSKKFKFPLFSRNMITNEPDEWYEGEWRTENNCDILPFTQKSTQSCIQSRGKL